MKYPNLEQMKRFDESNLPDLDGVVLAALELFMLNPAIDSRETHEIHENTAQRCRRGNSPLFTCRVKTFPVPVRRYGRNVSYV